jgi:hypothetical protein
MLEDTYGHSPIHKMFDNADVYGVAFDEERAKKQLVRLVIIGCGGVAQSKHIPAIMRLKTVWEPIQLVGVCMRNPKQGMKVQEITGATWYTDYLEMLDVESPTVRSFFPRIPCIMNTPWPAYHAVYMYWWKNPSPAISCRPMRCVHTPRPRVSHL